MSGYREIREFSAQEEEAIRWFMAARRLWIISLDADFVPSQSGALDYGEDWLNEFVEEFRSTPL
ncbi:hypothetical protein Q5741_09765 [Paenibacillus sp. JX-17]|uniref:Uncharacterized protein n=1 Tax=Paenibacillus lacisoli TaxID=3064525 RepID=A0ABT9CBR8_9BACL|nr:hypothetical protein [Paenibacillus sp. JX-17]MDO7906708.1 hypothetical protein [Paenibacillus sp. JX-17]